MNGGDDKDLSERLDNLLQSSSGSTATRQEQSDEGSEYAKRSRILVDTLEQLQAQKRKKNACPYCGYPHFTARSTPNHLIWKCKNPDCGKEWRAMVVPNSYPSRLPLNPVESAIRNMPRHRDPRKLFIRRG